MLVTSKWAPLSVSSGISEQHVLRQGNTSHLPQGHGWSVLVVCCASVLQKSCQALALALHNCMACSLLLLLRWHCPAMLTQLWLQHVPCSGVLYPYCCKKAAGRSYGFQETQRVTKLQAATYACSLWGRP